jgi:streptomycin 6-kinase
VTPDSGLCARLKVSDPILVAQTPIAHVWKVSRDKGLAALKVYIDGNTQDEAPGFDLLDALDGNGVARIYQRERTAVLMEWLDGPSLGDLARAGHDAQATAILAKVANTIHAQNPMLHLKSVAENAEGLLALQNSAAWPSEVQTNMMQAKALARRLINMPHEITPLHGDLHHDNIKQTERGNIAFDAKGLCGDRAYDVANAFKNPVGGENIYQEPERIVAMADSFSQILGITRDRILGWAAAHCALSIVWDETIADNTLQPHLRSLLSAYQSNK